MLYGNNCVLILSWYSIKEHETEEVWNKKIQNITFLYYNIIQIYINYKEYSDSFI